MDPNRPKGTIGDSEVAELAEEAKVNLEESLRASHGRRADALAYHFPLQVQRDKIYEYLNRFNPDLLALFKGSEDILILILWQAFATFPDEAARDFHAINPESPFGSWEETLEIAGSRSPFVKMNYFQDMVSWLRAFLIFLQLMLKRFRVEPDLEETTKQKFLLRVGRLCFSLTGEVPAAVDSHLEEETRGFLREELEDARRGREPEFSFLPAIPEIQRATSRRTRKKARIDVQGYEEEEKTRKRKYATALETLLQKVPSDPSQIVDRLLDLRDGKIPVELKDIWSREEELAQEGNERRTDVLQKYLPAGRFDRETILAYLNHYEASPIESSDSIPAILESLDRIIRPAENEPHLREADQDLSRISRPYLAVFSHHPRGSSYPPGYVKQFVGHLRARALLFQNFHPRENNAKIFKDVFCIQLFLLCLKSQYPLPSALLEVLHEFWKK